MKYKKITLGQLIIEFHNNWAGVETVIVNGQMVSQKSSVWGTDHFFSVIENGRNVRYVLTSKVDRGLQVFLDLKRNRVLIEENIPLGHVYSSRPQAKYKYNGPKKDGLIKLKNYDLKEALEDFEKALEIDDKDEEIYFHMACAYSVLEKGHKGFEAIRLAVDNGMNNQETIFNHDMLAYLRMQEAFEEFVESGFSEYDISKIDPDKEQHEDF